MAPTTTSEDVTAALEKVAKPAVSAPITVTGENGTSATLTPQDIAAALSFRPDPTAGLAPELNLDAITKVLRPQLAASETPGRDATLDFTGGHPGRRPVAGRPRRRLPRHPQGPGPGPHGARAPPGGRRLRRTAREAHHRRPVQAGHLRDHRRVHHPRVRRGLRDEHPTGRRADQRHDRAAGRAPSASTRSPTPATPRTVTSRRGSSRTGTPPAASAAASRRSPPRCTTRPTSRA